MDILLKLFIYTYSLSERETERDICGKKVKTTTEEKRGTTSEEISVRRGRPSRVESLMRGRTSSHGSILNFLKRKRGGLSPEEQLTRKRSNSETEINTRNAHAADEEEIENNPHIVNTSGISLEYTEMEFEGKNDRDILIGLAMQVAQMNIERNKEREEIKKELKDIKERIETKIERRNERDRQLESRIDSRLKILEN